ncbi:MAG: hypothetical protein ACXV5U_02870 [Ilumatobacteraceae bacterium]
MTATTIAGVALSFGVPIASATVDAPVRSGDVVVVSSSDGSHELTHGGSATKFSLRLPAGAACPGDSANDQWRVQSFVVPATDDPSTFKYTSVAPAGGGRYALYDVQTRPLINSLTQENLAPGQPGVIPAIPPLSFAVFPPGTLPSGTYRVGIACTLFRATAKYWDTQLVLTATPSDKPGQLVWRVANVSATAINNSSSGSNLWIIAAVAAGVAVAGALGWVFWRSRARRPRNRSFRRPRKNITFSKEPR